MTFTVEPSALDGYAGQIGRAADDASGTKNYLSGYTVQGGWNGALIALVGSSSVNSMNAAVAASQKASEILADSRQGLIEAASYYRSTDAAAAARLDATLLSPCDVIPTALENQWAANPCAPSFSDSREPSGRLKPVDDVEYSHPLGLLDNISVSHWALKGFDFVLGFNPLEKISDYFLGDWQAFAKAGKAISNAADALDDLGYNVQGGAISLQSSWQGEAATSAYTHFTGLASGVEDLVDPMREIAKQCDTISRGVWNSCESATGFVKGMLDAAIIAGISSAAGTITVETGIGAIVGYGIAAIEVTRILDMWAEATKVMTTVYGLVQAGAGLIEAQVSRLQGADLPELSGYGGYHHPLVAN
ncbi:WXG100 family type VII secretion target [Winogradskya humida]|uniref:WXG100 family type VII secretion target n=1 Tax=Winogradskya humida TaxID=113566 RepID=UPI001943D927|nr:WXG100 family type VII secretion target [Actinoplanes humidus]